MGNLNILHTVTKYNNCFAFVLFIPDWFDANRQNLIWFHSESKPGSESTANQFREQLTITRTIKQTSLSWNILYSWTILVIRCGASESLCRRTSKARSNRLCLLKLWACVSVLQCLVAAAAAAYLKNKKVCLAPNFTSVGHFDPVTSMFQVTINWWDKTPPIFFT